MDVQVIPKPGFPNRIKPETVSLPEQVQAACLQEQFNGLIPRRTERRMSEILAERQAETGPDGPAAAFIP